MERLINQVWLLKEWQSIVFLLTLRAIIMADTMGRRKSIGFVLCFITLERAN